MVGFCFCFFCHFREKNNDGGTLKWNSCNWRLQQINTCTSAPGPHCHNSAMFYPACVWPVRCVCSVLPGGEQPIPLWNEHDTSTDADKPKILLYSLSLRFKVSDVQFVSEMQNYSLWEKLCVVLKGWNQFKFSLWRFYCCLRVHRESRWQQPLPPCEPCALRRAWLSSSCPTESSARLRLEAAAVTWNSLENVKLTST